MIDPVLFYNSLRREGIDFFAGVPDSLLKHFCSCLDDRAQNHIIAANEGGAVALAIGHYLASARLPLIYMQNSGLGNAINPLLSLADRQVYGVPMLIMIGWRGEPSGVDEPQHKKQGRVMLAMLDAMELPYYILGDSDREAGKTLKVAKSVAIRDNTPCFLVVQKGSFAPYPKSKLLDQSKTLSREQAIETIAGNIGVQDYIVSTTGHASRELFEYRKNKGQAGERDFLTVGGMGHASHIALGLAMSSKGDNVYCIDGDGALLMHMGSLAINGIASCGNFRHIVINNAMHGSVGGQATVAGEIDICAIAGSCGYSVVEKVCTAEGLQKALARNKGASGSVFVEVTVNAKVRSDLARPNATPEQNKRKLMKSANLELL